MVRPINAFEPKLHRYADNLLFFVLRVACCVSSLVRLRMLPDCVSLDGLVESMSPARTRVYTAPGDLVRSAMSTSTFRTTTAPQRAKPRCPA
jgi:hypothetical protein